ncbi:MAG: 2-oxoglutarate and iron-dependent oxygenase domain-containing protein [Sphingobium sp.]|nr:isopenicillin N synthase family oxygenase [Sphingobium sp.]MCP5398683.1 isopenicillin N synthase family oxygenase [Sphingomonas sp.]
MSMVEDMIPILSLRQADTPELAEALGQSFRDYGFAVVRDHGMDEALIIQAWRLAEAFFALPDDTKRRYHVPGGAGQRGYTPFAQEIAKGASASDLKEFWHIGREADPDGSLPGGMPENIWPHEIPAFQICFTRLYTEFERVGALLLGAIAIHLGLDRTWFDDPTHQGNSILRLLHYPPLAPDAPAGAVRAGAHEDINLITLLLGAEEAGLQLLRRDGRWMDIRPPEGALVVNIGDMLQRLTNDALPSTTHRVINPPEERRTISRYSMPFFLHLRPDFIIDPLPQCVSTDNPARYAPISANDYLKERLREIGLLSAD